jgi:selT/selW/selH-like putative selenoprotein
MTSNVNSINPSSLDSVSHQKGLLFQSEVQNPLAAERSGNMPVEIKRCFMWGDIKAQAGSLKETIERQLKIPTKIKMGSLGAFEVFFNGDRIFSKKETGRMPQQEEIMRLLQARALWDAPQSIFSPEIAAEESQ